MHFKLSVILTAGPFSRNIDIKQSCLQICMVHKLGYGNWDELKAAFRTSPLFRFDWFVKSRTTQELARRCDTLIRLVEKENQEYDEMERQARKEKKLAKVLFTTIFSH